jgi:transposase
LWEAPVVTERASVGLDVHARSVAAAVACEAGPTGFGLYRSLIQAGIRCEVVAPSKLQKPSGDRVKTDAKDALHLVRARADARGDLMPDRHRPS